jgi:uncharacterized protein (DUF362 family)
MSKSKVAVLKTSPATVLDDYERLMDVAEAYDCLSTANDVLIKLNLSWTKYFPSCSSQPWQLEGVIKALLSHGFSQKQIIPLENKTVVTDPWKGAQLNNWLPILDKYGLKFHALPEQKWVVYPFKSKLLRLNSIFPEGIQIPEMFIGKQVLHLPTVKTHGHTTTTGAIKNAFGGLLKEVRHYAHKYIHEVMVDLMLMQKELHPSVFAVMDGTVCGDGAGPRTMIPKVKNYILASSDSVAIDAIAAKMMGFNPLEIPYLRMCNEMGIGNADPQFIEVVGEDVSNVNFGFEVSKSLVIWGDQMIRRGPLQPLEKILLHSPLVVWAPFASNVYHDMLWYPVIGQQRINEFNKTEWGALFESYKVKVRQPESKLS